MSGEKIEVTKSEYEAIMKAEKGVFIPRLEVFINRSFIAVAYPVNNADQIEERKNQQEGVLHDGIRVRRHFGQWVDAYNQVPDDNGKYVTVKFDETYYPEIARDCVPTPQEFEKIRHLDKASRLEIILQGTSERRISQGGFTKLI